MKVAWVTPSDPHFAAAAALFDEYRVHYGEAAAPSATRAWLASSDLSMAAALDGSVVRGFVTTAVIPASLTLGTAWLIRDLFVPPRERRRGVARALLSHVVDAARAAGARRVSLQTETGNDPALALYARLGFEPVTGLAQLNRSLG